MKLFKRKTKKPRGRPQPSKMLLWAIGFGILAAILAGLYIKQRAEDYLARLKAREAPEVAVVVAKTNLPRGTVLGSDNLAVRPVPLDLVPSGAVRPEQFPAVKGRVLVEPVAKGTPLLQAFIEDSIALDFSDTIDLGRRAMTIEVDELKSIGGLARPGNRIDIFAHLPPGTQSKGDNKDVVVPVLQDILVLATGKSAFKDYQEKVLLGGLQPEQRYTNITVNVSARQAALLAQAQDKGDLFTLLRNRKDRGTATFSEIMPADLFTNAVAMAQESITRNQARSLDNLRVTEDGRIVTKDGIEIKDPNIIVKDGVVMTKDGVVLNGKGLVVDKDGRIRTADGHLVSGDNISVTEGGKIITGDGKVLGDAVRVRKDGLLVTADGTLTTKDGRVLGKDMSKEFKKTRDGLLVTKDGKTVTRDGRVLGKVTRTRDGFYVDEQGRVLTKDGTVLEGVTVNENGEVVTADGRVLKAEDIVVNADGSVTTRDGEVLEGVSGKPLPVDEQLAAKIASGVTKTRDGFFVRGDGTVVTRDGTVLKGVRVNERGQVVTADGRVLKADDIVVNADGTVSTKSGRRIPGVTGEKLPAGPDGGAPSTIEFLAGGVSKDGVATVGELPVLK